MQTINTYIRPLVQKPIFANIEAIIYSKYQDWNIITVKSIFHDKVLDQCVKVLDVGDIRKLDILFLTFYRLWSVDGTHRYKISMRDMQAIKMLTLCEVSI